jgi:NAD(P)H-nitrite reductase large subunit
MNRFELVIAGGGLAAARAIKSYREAGTDGSIAMLCEEDALPYHRPALSKRYLRGETSEAPWVEDEAFYRDHDVEVLLGTPAAAVDLAERSVEMRDGRRVAYGRLLIATGAHPRRLDVPGADLDGVHRLRTLADSAAIRHAAGAAAHAVVIGGGFIGMEVAASLRTMGLEVTLVHLGTGLFDALRCDALSADLLALYRERGVDVLLGEQVSVFTGAGRLSAVITASGRRIEADLAVVGIGVAPATAFLVGSGLAVDDGVVVDERFRASAPGVYAAGDVASVYDPLYARRRRIEHWSNASYQGAEVGRLLAGGDGGFATVSSFFTELFGVTVKVFGDVTGFDALATDGSLAEGAFLAAYGERGRLVGAVAVGQDEGSERRLQEHIGEGAPLLAAIGERALAATWR